MPHIPEDPARKAARILSARHLKLGKLLSDHFCSPEPPKKKAAKRGKKKK